MAADISEQELHDVVVYLREYGRRLSRLLPALKSAQAWEDVHDIGISLNELVPLDIESALRPFYETPAAYARFRFSWALRDLLQKLSTVADLDIGSLSPPGLFSFVRHARRAISFAFLRLERAEAVETASPEPRHRKRVTTLRQRVPAFDDFLRTPAARFGLTRWQSEPSVGSVSHVFPAGFVLESAREFAMSFFLKEFRAGDLTRQGFGEVLLSHKEKHGDAVEDLLHVLLGDLSPWYPV